MDEGYIKFNCQWNKGDAFPPATLATIQKGRAKMYEQGLIGVYDNGIGFGNISQRYHQNQFIISGSTTGQFSVLQPQHYSLVTSFSIEQNRVECKGPIIASSESMSHAVIYQECPEINAVIHIHHLSLWRKLLFQIPTTSADATYGTPEMAAAIIHLIKTSSVRNETRFLAMAGHEEGLIVFGKTMSEAVKVVQQYLP